MCVLFFLIQSQMGLLLLISFWGCSLQVYRSKIGFLYWSCMLKSCWACLLVLIVFFFNCYLFIYLWLCWFPISVRGPSPAAASGDHSSSRCAGLSLSRPLLLQSTVSRHAGSAVVAHRPSCSAACGIFPDQGLNPCPLHWQADSQPLRHQGSPLIVFLDSLGFSVYKIMSSANIVLLLPNINDFYFIFYPNCPG